MKRVIGLFAMALLFSANYVNASGAWIESEEELNCVDFHSSCGETGTICLDGEETAEDFLAFDEYICG